MSDELDALARALNEPPADRGEVVDDPLAMFALAFLAGALVSVPLLVLPRLARALVARAWGR